MTVWHNANWKEPINKTIKPESAQSGIFFGFRLTALSSHITTYSMAQVRTLDKPDPDNLAADIIMSR